MTTASVVAFYSVLLCLLTTKESNVLKLAAVVGFLVIVVSAAHAVAGDCGIPPIPPIPPIGCHRMQPVCICDQNGNNCRWEFQCVR